MSATGPSNGGGEDVGGRSAEPTVIVTGAVGRLLWTVAVEFFEGRADEDDGVVVVTTRETPAVVARRLAADGPDREHLAIVDARGIETSGDGTGDEVDGAPGDETDAAVGHLRRVDPRASPGELDAAVTGCIKELDERGVERVHFLFDTLASGYRLPEPASTYDRAHELAMTVGAEDGVGLFTADTTRLPEEVVDELAHLVDVRVDLRRPTRTTELRWEGLLDASGGWRPLAEVDLRDGQFR